MNLLKKCTHCKKYTLRKTCPKCNSITSSTNYRFTQLRDAPSRKTTFRK